MTSGSVVFFIVSNFRAVTHICIEQGCSAYSFEFFYIVFTDSNFDISFRLPRVLNAAEHISKG